MRTWPFQDAKARLSELVSAAEREGPQEITVRGRPAAVLLSKADHDRLVPRKPAFCDFIRRSPLAGVDLKIERNRCPARGEIIDLWR